MMKRDWCCVGNNKSPLPTSWPSILLIIGDPLTTYIIDKCHYYNLHKIIIFFIHRKRFISLSLSFCCCWLSSSSSINKSTPLFSLEFSLQRQKPFHLPATKDILCSPPLLQQPSAEVVVEVVADGGGGGGLFCYSSCFSSSITETDWLTEWRWWPCKATARSSAFVLDDIVSSRLRESI